jgi:hypothetical protein
MTLAALMKARPAALPPRIPNPMIAPHPVRQVPLGQGVIRMVRQSRIIHPFDGGVLLQMAGNSQRVLAMLG